MFQTTIKELQDEIHSKLQMEPGFQEVYDCSGRRIDLLFGSLEEAGIKCGWKLIVVCYFYIIIEFLCVDFAVYYYIEFMSLFRKAEPIQIYN